MSELDEKLSLVLDEYSGDEKSNAVLDALVDDVDLQYQVRRYQMIGDVIRHELPDIINLGLSHQIMAEVRRIGANALLAENSDTPARTSSFWSWLGLKPLAGFAVAASVAVVSVSIWQSVSTEPQFPEGKNQLVTIEQQKIDKLASKPVQGSAVAVSSNLNEGMRWKVAEDSPDLQQKLNGYLINHTEYSTSMQGLIPQARVAGYDSQ